MPTPVIVRRSVGSCSTRAGQETLRLCGCLLKTTHEKGPIDLAYVSSMTSRRLQAVTASVAFCVYKA